MGRGRSRTSRGTRSTSGGGGGRKYRAYSRSVSSLMSRRSANSQDGNMRRGWNYPQSTSMYYDPFPRKMRAILRYSQTFNLNPAMGGTAHQLFRATSIFDPDLTGTGHQPYGHDLYQQIYNHYKVVKAIIKVTSVEGDGNAIFGVTMTDDSTVSTTYDTVREIKPTKWLAVGDSNQSQVLTQTYDAMQTFGPDMQERLVGSFGINPAENSYFDVFMQAANGPGGTAQLHSFVASITYYTEFTELKDLGQS